MAASLKDVAYLAQVSLTTASHALNGKPVNEGTRKRVMEAAKKLNYHKSAIGRNLINNRSNTIGMLVLNSKASGDMTEEISYYYKMIMGALASIGQREYMFNFEVQYWEEIKHNDFISKKVLGRSVDGMILIPQYMYCYDFLSQFENESFPYVIVNPSTEIKAASRIIIDNYRGGYLAASHLVELGHKHVAVINGPKDHTDSFNRERGFLSKLLEVGIRFNRDEIIYSDFTNEGGYKAMIKVLAKNGHIPTAVFCANDYMAAGAVAAIYEKGLKVPDDISIVGYDDIDVARAVYPKLTTIQSPVKELGFLAVERVLKMINSKEESLNLQQIVLEPTLIIRNSTRSIN